MPTLRFPGFTEEWLQLPLNNVLEKLENGTTYNPNENTGFPMSRIETIAKGVIDYNRVGYCSEVKRLERYRMRKGDILFSHINSAKHIGKSAYYEEEQPLYHGMNLLLMRTNSDIDSKFLFYLINNSCFLRRCQILAKQAVNQASLSTSDLKGIGINMPSKSEQKKIAGFISLLDERISLQSNLIDRLKSLMDGIIDKMTARTPNIFIENCLDCYSSTLQEGETEKQGTYPVYGANGVCGYLDYATISAPAILIVKDGSGVGNVSYTNGDCSVVGTLNYLQPKKGVLAKFLYFVLKRFNFQPYKTGMAIPHIYFKAYSKARIFCPDYEEQSRVAVSLSRIEDKIALEERLLSLLQEQKHYLLSVMFI